MMIKVRNFRAMVHIEPGKSDPRDCFTPHCLGNWWPGLSLLSPDIGIKFLL